MALEIQVEEIKVQPGKAQKHYENTVDPVFLTYAWHLSHNQYIYIIVLITIPYPRCFVEPSRQPQVCKFDT